MKNGTCSRFFPKKLQDVTIINEKGRAYYKRRDNALDNQFFISYNLKVTTEVPITYQR